MRTRRNRAKFSLAKRKCGVGMAPAKLQETAAHVFAMSVLLLNLRKIQCAFFHILFATVTPILKKKKLAIVQ